MIAFGAGVGLGAVAVGLATVAVGLVTVAVAAGGVVGVHV